jgi:hypothetical protein
MSAEVHEALERSVEVLRQLEVFDDITALIDSQPVVSILCTSLFPVNGVRCSSHVLQALFMWCFCLVQEQLE